MEIAKVMVEVGDDRARAELCQRDSRPLVDLMDRLPAKGRTRHRRTEFEDLMVDDPSQIPKDPQA